VFFILSKILDVVLTPLAWAIVLILLGVGKGSASRGRRALPVLGVAVLLLFSFESVSNRLWRSLEQSSSSTVRPGVTYDVVILLGGVTENRVEATWGQRAFNNNNERLLETFDLLRKGTAKNAIVSCGAPPSTPTEVVESMVLRDQLVAWGIEPDRIVLEDQSRNTHENAAFSSAIVRARGWQTVLLVTSAFHVPRAIGCFQKEGLAVDVLPVDYRSFASTYPSDLLPRAEYLEQSTAAMREWFGRAVYRLRGYSV